MGKHTPGPWNVQRENGSPTTGQWMISGGNPGYLAEVRDLGVGEVKANAFLISAAPELLEALIEAMDLIDDICALEGDSTRKARAAIAKARGEV